MLELYLAHCSAKGIRPNTITMRRGYLGRIPNRDQASTDDLLLWIGRQTWTAGTRACVLSILRGYYYWLRRRGYRPDDPTEDLDRVRVPKRSPRPAPDRVVDGALFTASERDQLMVALGVWAGLRRAEIAALRWVDVEDQVLHVRDGKGGKPRVVRLEAHLGRLLEAEQRRRLAGRVGTGFRWQVDPGSPWVFPSHVGGHMTPASVGRTVKAALGGVWTAHTLRHRFATTAYAAGKDLLTVQRLMGHESPNTTQLYVDLDLESAAAAVAGASRGLLFAG